MGELNVGSEAIDRDSTQPENATIIDLANPAAANFVVDTVEVFPNIFNHVYGFRVGSFYLVGVNTFTCRASATIGYIEADGTKKTFSGLSIAFQSGDFIGCYWTGGRLERTMSGGVGFQSRNSECIDPGDTGLFSPVGWVAFQLSCFGKCTVILGQPYILRVQGIPGMRSFSQMGHGGM